MKTNTHIVLKFLFIILAALVGAHAIAVLITSRQVKQAYEKFEEAGRPIVPEDIIPPPISSSDNAAILYRKAFLLIEASTADLDDEKNPLRLAGNEIKAEQISLIRDFLHLSPVRSAIELIPDANKKPGVRYHEDYLQGPEMNLPELAGIRNLHKVLLLKIRYQLHENAPAQELYTTFENVLGLCNALRNEPFLISGLVRIQQISLTLDLLKQAIEQTPPSAAQVVALKSRLDALRIENYAHQIFDGERILFGDLIFRWALTDLNHEGLGDLGVSIKSYGSYLLRPISNADHAAYLNHMFKFTKALDNPDARQSLIDSAEDIPRYCPITLLIAPDLIRPLEKFEKMDVQIEEARSALSAIQK